MGDFLRLRSFYCAVVAPLMRLSKRAARKPLSCVGRRAEIAFRQQNSGAVFTAPLANSSTLRKLPLA
jgi:hypothetical protein